MKTLSSRYTQVASLALLAQVTRIFSGPVILLFISGSLTKEQMSFYFPFFNLIAMQQLLELGIGFTIKQFISHAFKETDGVWCVESIRRIKSYFRLALLWFVLLSLFILFGIGFFGAWFFSSYDGDVNWILAWWSLVTVTALTTLMTPVQFIIEGTQKQIELYKGKMLYSLVSSISICFSLYCGLGLFSVAISVCLSNIALYVYLSPTIKLLFNQIIVVEGYGKSIRGTLVEMWPMLSKISITWLTGYFFWNSFNLIAFKELSPEMAGQFGFTLSLARAGYGVAESLVGSQSTIYSQEISNGNILKAKSIFEKSMLCSMLLLFTGYVSYILLYVYFPGFYFFEKTLDFNSTIPMFLYFFLLLPVVLMANFCRCFKEERYLKLSLFCNISVPLFFYISSVVFGTVTFLVLLPLSVIFIFWSLLLFSKVVSEKLVLLNKV